MYHAVVRRQLRGVFTSLNKGEYAPTVNAMAERFEHRFAGDHPLGGVRHTRDGLTRWFERLFRLTQHLDFDIQHIVVAGWPWDTTGTIEWTDNAQLADGQPYTNHGVHVVRLRWFRAVSIHANLDTARWEAACARMAAAGNPEAAAAPIQD